jgi:hypothetical protein
LDVDQWVERYREAVQPKVRETVLAAGPFRRSGGSRAGHAQHSTPLLGTFRRRLSRKRPRALPPSFLLAVTPTRVHAFRYRPVGSGVAVDDWIDSWNRATLVVTAERTALTTRLALRADGGQPIEIDTGTGGYADPVVRYLVDRKRTA